MKFRRKPDFATALLHALFRHASIDPSHMLYRPIPAESSIHHQLLSALPSSHDIRYAEGEVEY